MNTKHITALLALSALAWHPAHSQETKDKPADAKPAEETVKPADKPDGRGKSEGERGERGGPDHKPRGPQPEMKPTAYIGVMTRGVPPEVRAQTGLAEGFGLLVEEVMPDSPAQKAGLQQHDVLILLGDQKLVNQEQLSTLVRAEKKDADLSFTLKRAGTEQKITIKVGERLMPVATHDRGRDGFEPFHMFGREGERFNEQLHEGVKRFQQGVKEFQERMQGWSRDPKDNGPARYDERRGDNSNGRDNGPDRYQPDRRGNDNNGFRRPPQQQDGPRRDGEPQRDRSVSSSSTSSYQRNVVRRDDSGEYSLREDGGAKLFVVKPKDGEEQTFIINTDEQRKAIPEALQAKLKELENVNGRVPADAAPAPQAAPKPGA
jgi:hypothetical protein